MKTGVYLVAIYCRVSTKKQEIAPQLNELRGICAQRGWTIAGEYSDKISGSTLTRTGLDQLMADAKARKFNAIMVVKIDRLARSLVNFVNITQELESYGVALIAPGQGIDTSDRTPVGILQRQILAAVAEFERSLIRERIQASVDLRKERGVRMGKPSKNLVGDWKEVLEQWHQGRALGFDHSIRDLARELGGVSTATAWRLSKLSL